MVDIHSHILYGVDDGAKTISESEALFRVAASQGIHAMIVTPHYRVGMFPYEKEKIEAHFEKCKAVAQSYDISLFLGCEYHADTQMAENLQSNRVHTLADGEYVLTEFKTATGYSFMRTTVQEVFLAGYVPIIAHAERYLELHGTDKLGALREMGARIQVNADSILGYDGWELKRVTKKYLKQGLVDLVASDAHNMTKRPIRLGECYAYVAKKYGEDTAHRLFVKNPRRVLDCTEPYE